MVVRPRHSESSGRPDGNGGRHRPAEHRDTGAKYGPVRAVSEPGHHLVVLGVTDLAVKAVSLGKRRIDQRGLGRRGIEGDGGCGCRCRSCRSGG